MNVYTRLQLQVCFALDQENVASAVRVSVADQRNLTLT